jgi:hypothetical protein
MKLNTSTKKAVQRSWLLLTWELLVYDWAERRTGI